MVQLSRLGLADALNDREKSIKGSKILVLGIAYKKNVDDMRESPSVELMDILRSKGAVVSYSDPYVPVFPKMRRYRFDLESIALSQEELRGYDAVLLATDHDSFDYQLIADSAALVVDTRGRYKGGGVNIVGA